MNKLTKFLISVIFTLLFCIALAVIIIGKNGFYAPDWAVKKFESEFNKNLNGTLASIGEAKIQFFNRGNFLSATFFKVILTDSNSSQLAYLNELEASFNYNIIFSEDLKPNSLTILNSTLIITRNLEGNFSVDLSEKREKPETTTYSEVVELLDWIENLLQKEQLKNLNVISAKDSKLAFVDHKSGKTLWFKDGEFLLENEDDRLLAQFSAELLYGDDFKAAGLVKMVKMHGEKQVSISANIENIKIDEFAKQFPKVSFLSSLRLPASLATTATLLDDGTIEGLQGVFETSSGEVYFPKSSQKIFVNEAKIYFEYNRRFGRIDVKQLSIDTEYGSSLATGRIYSTIEEGESADEFIGQFEFYETFIKAGKIVSKDFAIDKFITDFKFDLRKSFVEFGQFSAQFEKFQLRGDGGIKFSENGVNIKSNFSFSDLQVLDLVNFWPLIEGQKSKIWAQKNINRGDLKNIVGQLSIDPSSGRNIDVSFEFDGGAVQLPEKFPPIENVSGHGSLSSNGLNIKLSNGDVYFEPANLIDLAGSTLEITDTDNFEKIVNLNIISVSSLPAALRFLEGLPPEYRIPKSILSLNLQGLALGRTKLSFPLKSGFKGKKILFSTLFELKSILTDQILKPWNFSAKTLFLEANNKLVSLKGEAFFAGIPVSGEWSKSFDSATNNISKLDGQLTLNKSAISILKLEPLGIKLNGESKAVFSIKFEQNSPPLFKLKSDLKGLNLSHPAINWQKPSATLSTLQLEGRFSDPIEVSNISFNSPGLSIDGKLFFKENGSVERFFCQSMVIEDWLSLILEAKPKADGNYFVNILGGDLNLSLGNNKSIEKMNPLAFPFLIDLDTLTITEKIILNNLKADFTRIDEQDGTFYANLNNGPAINGTLRVQNEELALTVRSNDAGAVLSTLGLFGNARNGELKIDLVKTDSMSSYSGELVVKNTRVVNAPVLAELLSAVSVIGLLEQMDGQGLAFSESKASFSFDKDIIRIYDSSAIGASMGLTMVGSFDPNNGAIDANGVITPFYAVNGIFEQSGLFAGLLGKREGEGVFGFNYGLKSDGAEIKVDVNPLSILTPGVFRELFNSTMPERLE